MDFVQFCGWMGAVFTLSALAMRTMLPLRIAALAANVFFFLFGWLIGSDPTWVLHLVLLPFNSWRLFEILRMRRSARNARASDHPLDWIKPLVKPVPIPAGAYVFQKGDAPDRIYYLSSGRVRLEEIDVPLDAGELFGEIAFFTEAHERTLSARAETDCEILALDERDFLTLYYQNPAFGLYIVRLIAKRLMEGVAKHPYAYLPARMASPGTADRIGAS